jgi:hypothetical protein
MKVERVPVSALDPSAPEKRFGASFADDDAAGDGPFDLFA